MLLSVGGQVDQNKRQVLIPILVLANLDASGDLSPSDKAPWIPREWLAPNQSSDVEISDVSTVDDFMTTNPFNGVSNWKELIDYCNALIRNAVDNGSDQKTESKYGLFDIEFSEQYRQSGEFLIQVEVPVTGAKQKILRSYDKLIEREYFPSLYECFGDSRDKGLKDYYDKTNDKKNAKRHIGQMTGEFPLSDKQRNALHHLYETNSGELLAVNGPPGTGKTALLRSIVADLWTNAALELTEPPIIVAASSNNQAVTNILESFGKINEEGIDDSLFGRWLPEVDSYGLYCCSKGSKSKDHYQHYCDRDLTTMSAWQTQDFLKRAKEYFIDKSRLWKNIPDPTVEEVKEQLHTTLVETKKTMIEGFSLYDTYDEINKDLSRKYSSKNSLASKCNEAIDELSACSDELALTESIYRKLLHLWAGRGFWVNLLIWFPPVKRAECRKTELFVIDNKLKIKNFDDKSVETWFSKLKDNFNNRKDELEAKCKELESDLQKWHLAEKKIKNWIGSNGLRNLYSDNYYNQVVEVSDRLLRFKMFKLATHYWEAAWIEELESFLKAGGKETYSPRKISQRLKRYAMITPCTVSTFYMIPSFLTAYEKRDGVWKDIPLFEEIDLLIVDEAGQAQPEVAAASFAFAKKAVIVGDVDQIEPVWQVPVAVDRSNLVAFDLFEDEMNYDRLWLESGHMASNGNVMRVAQRQTSYHQFAQLQRGLYLTEHRRCYDRIISYCNELIYEGVLEAKRGDPKEPVPWGELSFVEVRSQSKKYGGSRGNEGEAQEISRWLSSNYETIVSYAREHDSSLSQVDDRVVFQKSIGIVTPFKKQAQLISQKARALDLPEFTVGTVHGLQGDEKLIVLFSSVYGIEDINVGKFYDRQPNMLNVAVSRAKNSFIVFGNSNVFGIGPSDSPSGLLRARLS